MIVHSKHRPFMWVFDYIQFPYYLFYYVYTIVYTKYLCLHLIYNVYVRHDGLRTTLLYVAL